MIVILKQSLFFFRSNLSFFVPLSALVAIPSLFISFNLPLHGEEQAKIESLQQFIDMVDTGRLTLEFLWAIVQPVFFVVLACRKIRNPDEHLGAALQASLGQIAQTLFIFFLAMLLVGGVFAGVFFLGSKLIGNTAIVLVFFAIVYLSIRTALVLPAIVEGARTPIAALKTSFQLTSKCQSTIVLGLLTFVFATFWVSVLLSLFSTMLGLTPEALMPVLVLLQSALTCLLMIFMYRLFLVEKDTAR